MARPQDIADFGKIIEQAISEIQKKKQYDNVSAQMLSSMEEGLLKALTPAFEKLTETMRTNMANIKMTAPKMDMPPMEVHIPPIDIPAPVVHMPAPVVNVPAPVVNVPAPIVNVKASDLKMPDLMRIVGDVSLKDHNAKNPVPVMLYGTDGKPILSFGGGGGGKVNFFTLKEILTSSGNSVIDDTNTALRVNIVAGSSSGVTGPGVSDNALRIVMATDSVSSVNIVSGSSSGTQYNDGATPDQAGGIVTVAGLFDGGSVQSWQGSSYGIGQVQLTGFDGSLVGITSNALDVNLKSEGVTLEVRQVSGGLDSISIASQPFTLDVKQVSGGMDSVSIASQPFTFDVKQVSGSTDSINVSTLNGTTVATDSGVTGPGVLRIVHVTDVATSVNVTGVPQVMGDIASGSTDTGSNPVKIGGVVHTSNPTALADGKRTDAFYDAVGRAVMTPVQIRGLRSTAYATLNSNTETTLLASGSGVFNDLVYIAFANTSSGTVNIDLRDATAAGIVQTYAIPANATQGFSLSMPIPQNVAADTWTVDFNTSDVSNTTVYVNALFAKNVG